MDENLIPVNVVVGDRTYRVRINPADEEAVRKTARTINDKIVEFKTAFAGKDMQDYISMVLLWYATTVGTGPGGGAGEEDLGRMEALESILDKVLQK